MAASTRSAAADLDWVADLLDRPRGARFYRCALQVNPFAYVQRHTDRTDFATEADYDEAMVAACRDNGVEVIAVTDHYRVKTATSLIAAAEAAGIAAFPGFEAVTKDGVHLLCIFDRDSDLNALERRVGECAPDMSQDSPLGDFDAMELMERCATRWGAVCVAAHVAAPGGLLRKLSGQTRINAWRSPHLAAVALPGPVDDAPEDLRPILRNRNPDYFRYTLPAVVNATDVSEPDDLARERSWCEIEMSDVSLRGLRLAFADYESRVRITGDDEPAERTEIVGLRWEGGFLDGLTLPLNGNLNVLIGGRGTGKSTVVESLRYVFDQEPFGETAQRAHRGIVRDVLGSGTRVSALVRSHHPSLADYVLERVVPNPPTVRDAETGRLLDLLPKDVVPRAEVYGQHEIATIARSSEGRTRVLERFVAAGGDTQERKAALRRDLAGSRRRIADALREADELREQLDQLPYLEETLRRYKEAGVEDRLAERSLLVREERVLETAEVRLARIEEALEALRDELPLDRAFASAAALDDLPGAATLTALDGTLARLDSDLDGHVKSIDRSLATASARVAETRAAWDERRQSVEAEYEKILRELSKDDIDGAEFIRLRRQIETLKPLRAKLRTAERSLNTVIERRRTLLVEWEDVKAAEYRALQAAAKRVSRRLAGQVRVTVAHAADREPLLALLREEVGGNLANACDRLENASDLSLTALAAAMREGADTLVEQYRLTTNQAARIAASGGELAALVEELEMPSTTDIALNVGPDDAEVWQTIDRVSAGQQATAILLLLLLESDAPLIVDQPEDDLDNRFVADGVVPRVRAEKRRRQFVFATHNANLPVLGDAELIAGFSFDGEGGIIEPDRIGSIDVATVQQMVEAVLEGGRAAFEERRRKYGIGQ